MKTKLFWLNLLLFFSIVVNAQELKVKSFVIKKLLPYVRQYSEEEIIDKLYKLSEIDSDIKIKGFDKIKSLESFFISL